MTDNCTVDKVYLNLILFNFLTLFTGIDHARLSAHQQRRGSIGADITGGIGAEIAQLGGYCSSVVCKRPW